MTDIQLEEEFIQTNGIRLHTMLAGPKSGPPVILLYGFPEFWRGWAKQLPALVEAGFRVIIPDQRGYNLSDKPQGIKNYRVEELVKDILGLIDAPQKVAGNSRVVDVEKAMDNLEMALAVLRGKLLG